MSDMSRKYGTLSQNPLEAESMYSRVWAGLMAPFQSSPFHSQAPMLRIRLSTVCHVPSRTPDGKQPSLKNGVEGLIAADMFKEQISPLSRSISPSRCLRPDLF